MATAIYDQNSINSPDGGSGLPAATLPGVHGFLGLYDDLNCTPGLFRRHVLKTYLLASRIKCGSSQLLTFAGVVVS